ncbi:DUF3861 family protein [uncultured Muribaculum sp.]|uniref:DUF3861 family protein n=1 Tax=uncultured Muribaculum sp. TaxID=1918613 RepID=UPI0026475248|nr:DUF3861 family protein [uncultured Muribaculum sp.]
MDKEKKSYYFNVIEAKDGKMSEVMDFNFGGHHDLAALVEKTKAAGLFSKDKHAKEFVVAMRLLHHVMKKNADNPLFAEFAPQFEAFKNSVRAKTGCGCGGHK